jgi:hypothetical protein
VLHANNSPSVVYETPQTAVLAPVLLNISDPEIIKLICVLAVSQTHSFTDENINYRNAHSFLDVLKITAMK